MPSALKPLCFVLMPFGIKPDPGGRPDIDFNRVYEKGIRPAIEEAGLLPIRADEEKTGGIIHKPMFERLMLCEYAVADLTTANANVYYELGVRHATRPRTTLPIYAKHQPMAFDVNFLRALPYDLGLDNRFGDEEAATLRQALHKRLCDLRDVAVEHEEADSPIFQLLGEWKPSVAHLKTDLFRDQVQLNEDVKQRLAKARAAGREEGLSQLREIRREFGKLDSEGAGIVVDLLLSFRALKAWTDMIDLYKAMPETLKRQILVREQLAFALNRRAGEEKQPEDRQQALKILEDVETQQGPSSETCGLIGRIYKDLWDENRKSNAPTARGHLKKAIEAYTRGFDADWRDAYPGINAVTLLDIQGSKESLAERDRRLPVVRFAVEKRLGTKTVDYWDHATLLELAVLASDVEKADEHLGDALAAVREVWEPETTARNLRLIQEARAARGEETGWISEVVAALEARAIV